MGVDDYKQNMGAYSRHYISEQVQHLLQSSVEIKQYLCD